MQWREAPGGALAGVGASTQQQVYHGCILLLHSQPQRRAWLGVVSAAAALIDACAMFQQLQGDAVLALCHRQVQWGAPRPAVHAVVGAQPQQQLHHVCPALEHRQVQCSHARAGLHLNINAAAGSHQLLHHLEGCAVKQSYVHGSAQPCP
jgi:hypothetical protein